MWITQTGYRGPKSTGRSENGGTAALGCPAERSSVVSANKAGERCSPGQPRAAVPPQIVSPQLLLYQLIHKLRVGLAFG